VILEAVALDLRARHQDPEGNGEVEPGAVLPHVGRGQVDRDPLERKGEPRVEERRVDPLPALLDRSMREPDRGHRREAVSDVDLDVHQVGVDAEDGGGTDPGKHAGGTSVESSHGSAARMRWRA